jgi:hypothetical protein
MIKTTPAIPCPLEIALGQLHRCEPGKNSRLGAEDTSPQDPGEGRVLQVLPLGIREAPLGFDEKDDSPWSDGGHRSSVAPIVEK